MTDWMDVAEADIIRRCRRKLVRQHGFTHKQAMEALTQDNVLHRTREELFCLAEKTNVQFELGGPIRDLVRRVLDWIRNHPAEVLRIVQIIIGIVLILMRPPVAEAATDEGSEDE